MMVHQSSEIDVRHQAAKIMVETSKATDTEVGGGTTSTVVLVGVLLERAEEIIAKNVHPIIVVDGFKRSCSKAIEMLKQIGIKIDPQDRKFLKKVATTTKWLDLVDPQQITKVVSHLFNPRSNSIAA